jgi:hypothetical protein
VTIFVREAMEDSTRDKGGKGKKAKVASKRVERASQEK